MAISSGSRPQADIYTKYKHFLATVQLKPGGRRSSVSLSTAASYDVVENTVRKKKKDTLKIAPTMR